MAAVKELDATIGLEYRPHQCGHVVTLGATGTNLISIRQQLREWDPEVVHGQVLDYEEISKAVNWLGGMTLDERRAIPGLEPGREHTLHAHPGTVPLLTPRTHLHGQRAGLATRLAGKRPLLHLSHFK
jgi:exopolyphosphatase/pppGpp-phosphohydrolase